MSKPERNTKPTIRKPSVRPKSRRAKRPHITAMQARRLAERHVLNREFKNVPVLDGAKAELNIYRAEEWKKSDVWVVYKNLQCREPVFTSSLVILICKRTGRVIYEGSAGDEG